MLAEEQELLEAVLDIDWWNMPGGWQLLAELSDKVKERRKALVVHVAAEAKSMFAEDKEQP